MEKISTATQLRSAIKNLEAKNEIEGPKLKLVFMDTYESLKLINVVKSTFKEAITSPDLKDNFLSTAIGLGAGYLAKKTIIGKTSNPLKKLLGIVLELTVANKVSHNADSIKTVGTMIVNKITDSANGTKAN